MSAQGAHIIVLGNEKGGSGKSTTAMHVVAALLTAGKRVGAVDLDSRQRSLDRYLENRESFMSQNAVTLPMPERFTVPRSQLADRVAAAKEEQQIFEQGLHELWSRCDYIVIDSPGSDTPISRLAHACADTLITPLNDSFVDFDLLARIDPETYEIKGPSVYSEMVWESRKRAAGGAQRQIDWVVMRNRVSHGEAKNKQRVAKVLKDLSKRIGFRLAPGFGERVIFRELFPLGLTLLDLGQERSGIRLTMSHVAARQEVRALIATLDLPDLDVETL